MKKRKDYTIRDIARIANVSRSTVSLVLNNSDKVSEKTRKKVLAIIKKVGYHPNYIARSLVSKKSYTIGVIVPKISHLFTDLFFAETISGIIDTLQSKKYDVMLQVADEEYIKSKAYFKIFKEKRVDGGIFVGNLNTDYYIKEVVDAHYPVCLVNNSILGISRVVADNVTGTYEALEHLVKLGHRRIGFIKGLDEVTAGVDRYLGFKWAREKFGLDKDENLIVFGNFSEQSGYEAMKQLLNLKPLPTAVFASNDMMAIGAMKAIKEARLKIPEDISVIGADNNILSKYVEPKLTTIDQQMYLMGQKAVELMFEIINEKKYTEPVEIIVPTKLIIRESTGKPRKKL